MFLVAMMVWSQILLIFTHYYFVCAAVDAGADAGAVDAVVDAAVVNAAVVDAAVVDAAAVDTAAVDTAAVDSVLILLSQVIVAWLKTIAVNMKNVIMNFLKCVFGDSLRKI